jgi:membrane associated rhomboid family serine protease
LVSSSESSSELSVVCRNCGSEVSPYVTECPYCGTRIRKRAPKLERRGDEIVVREPRRRRRRRGRSEGRAPGRAADRPRATYAAILGPAALLVVQRAANLAPTEVGAIAGSVGSEWWRYLAAPFVYDDVGYLFAIAIAIAIFVPGLERRLGTVPALLLLVACGALGMLAAAALSEVGLDDPLLAAGGNGVALGALGAWLVLRQADVRRRAGEVDYDLIGVAVVAVVLLALPLLESSASPIAGLAGGLIGLLVGATAAASGRTTSG